MQPGADRFWHMNAAHVSFSCTVPLPVPVSSKAEQVWWTFWSLMTDLAQQRSCLGRFTPSPYKASWQETPQPALGTTPCRWSHSTGGWRDQPSASSAPSSLTCSQSTASSAGPRPGSYWRMLPPQQWIVLSVASCSLNTERLGRKGWLSLPMASHMPFFTFRFILITKAILVHFTVQGKL